jgi:hypothetical protein
VPRVGLRCVFLLDSVVRGRGRLYSLLSARVWLFIAALIPHLFRHCANRDARDGRSHNAELGVG